MPAKKDSVTGTQSIERALSLLKHFSDERPELRISELVTASGLGQSTVSRLVGALVALGFVRQEDRTGLYTLGPETLRLSNIALNSSPLHQRARQIAQDLAHTTRLGANVAELAGDRFLYLLNFEGPDAPRPATLVGRTGPLHATALGKALLSGLPADEIIELLPEPLPRYTTHTLTKHRGFLEELELVRETGYAREVEEAALGRACVAAPVRARNGQIVGALSISGSLTAMNLQTRESELAALAVHWASEISSGMGYLGNAMT